MGVIPGARPMGDFADREHFIPLRRTDLRELLSSDERLGADDRARLQQFCTLVDAVFHFEYHRELEALKDRYAPFDPDSDTRVVRQPDAGERSSKLDELFPRFTALMERANFRRLSDEEILRSTTGESGAFGINMDVDMTVFERVAVFWRGD